MSVENLIISSSRYAVGYSVSSIQGYKKVSLVVADEGGIPTGFEFEIDATENIDVSYSKSVQTHSSESRKVYMDGTKINPVTMTISGHIDSDKLTVIQSFMTDDTWLYVNLIKDMGGAMVVDGLNAFSGGQTVNYLDGTCDIYDGFYSDCKLYFMKSLSLGEEGFKNTVSFKMELTEVVLFEYDVEYKYGVKRNPPQASNGGQTTNIKKIDRKKDLETSTRKNY